MGRIHRTVVFTHVVAALLFVGRPTPCAAGGLGKTVSFHNLTAKADAKAFFAEGGAKHVGKRVHIHVPARRIHVAPARSIIQKKGGRYLFFASKAVPIVARANNVYLRKARQRTSKSDTLCVKGVVKRDRSPGGTGNVILVSRMTKAPRRKP